jgi:hypothetical protein
LFRAQAGRGGSASYEANRADGEGASALQVTRLYRRASGLLDSVVGQFEF